MQGFEEAAQSLLAVAFDFQEHDPVAELRMAGDDATADDDDLFAERKLDPDALTDGELIVEQDAAAVQAQVAGVRGNFGKRVEGLELDRDLDGEALMEPALGLGGGWFVL